MAAGSVTMAAGVFADTCIFSGRHRPIPVYES